MSMRALLFAKGTLSAPLLVMRLGPRRPILPRNHESDAKEIHDKRAGRRILHKIAIGYLLDNIGDKLRPGSCVRVLRHEIPHRGLDLKA